MAEISLDFQEINLDAPELSGSKEISLNNGGSDSILGDGIELLMNDKVKNKKSNSSNDLESELKMIEETNDIVIENEQSINLNQDNKESNSFVNKPKIEIAKVSSVMEQSNETWDGFKDINSINIEDIEKQHKKMTQEELLKEKFEVLRKLETIQSKGATLSKQYNMNSDLEEMKGEYEFLMNEKEKSNSVKFQGKVLTTMITGIEFLNNKFDPFDIKLDGWSEQVNESIDDFDEIFAELHEKYKSKAKMAPEIKLLFQLVSSGVMIHMTNTMFKSALPGMDDIMRQNPDLMNQFTKAAMNSMEHSTPGLGNFVNDFGMSHNQRQQPNNNQSMPSNYDPRPPSPPPPPVSHQSSKQPKQNMRREMKGPENIDSILSKLTPGSSTDVNIDNTSTISMEELESLGGVRKKSSKRKSDKNIISLAI